MTITVKKEVEETLELETPSAWFVEKFNRYYLIEEDGTVMSFSDTQVTKWPADSSMRDGEIKDALKGERIGTVTARKKLRETLQSFSIGPLLTVDY